MTKLVKLRFTRDAIYRVRGYAHPDNPVFAAGSAHEMREDLAKRWLKRGAAVIDEKKASDGNELQAADTGDAPPANGDDGGNQPAVDKRIPRKILTRNN